MEGLLQFRPTSEEKEQNSIWARPQRWVARLVRFASRLRFGVNNNGDRHKVVHPCRPRMQRESFCWLVQYRLILLCQLLSAH